MVGLKSDVFKLSCDMLLANMEMPFSYVEEDSNLNLIDQNKFKCLKSATTPPVYRVYICSLQH